MTEIEKQAKLHELEAEKQEAINNIARRKGELRKKRMEEITKATDAYCNQKRKTLAEIERIRGEKYNYGWGTQRRQEIEEDAQREERKLSQQKSEHEADLHGINARFATAMLALDNEERDAISGFQWEKAALWRDYVDEMKQAEQ